MTRDKEKNREYLRSLSKERRRAYEEVRKQREAAKKALGLPTRHQAKPEELKRRQAGKLKASRREKALARLKEQGLPATELAFNRRRPPVAYETPFPRVAGKTRTPSESEADFLGYLVAAPFPIGMGKSLREIGIGNDQFRDIVATLEMCGLVVMTDYGAVATPLGESVLPQLVDAAREDRIAGRVHFLLSRPAQWKRENAGGIRLSKRTRYHVLSVGRCQNCGWAVSSGAHLHVDHIKPLAKGGTNARENLQALCAPCNLGKSDFYEAV